MYECTQQLLSKSFKRKCGVQRETFDNMVEVLKPKLTRQGKREADKESSDVRKIENILIQSGEFD